MALPRAEGASCSDSAAGRQPPGRHHNMVQIGTGLLRSQRRSAKSFASMTS